MTRAAPAPLPDVTPTPSALGGRLPAGEAPGAGTRVPLREQADAAHRELAMRHRVYPGLVKRGRMTEAEAAREISLMRAIRDTLRLFAEHESLIREVLSAALRRQRQIAEAEEIAASEPAARAVLDAFPGAVVVPVPEAPRGADGEPAP